MTLRDEAISAKFNEPLSDDPTSTPSFPAYKNTGLQGTHAAFPKAKSVKIKSAQLAKAISQSKSARPGRHRWG